MGHLGLTPQSVHAMGGFKVQGRGAQDALRILEDAHRLQEAGCFALVLEGIPSELAARITQSLSIPTIGIGAGPDCSGQVLVLHDVLGLTQGHRPKFVRTYLDGFDLLQQALAHWAEDVRSGAFPSCCRILRPAGRCPGCGCRLGATCLHPLMRPADAHLPHDQVPDPVPARLSHLGPAGRLRADHGLPA